MVQEVPTLLILSRADLESIIAMKDAIEATQMAFEQIGLGEVASPTRPSIDIKKYGGSLLLNCGYLSQKEALGAKVATSYPGNAKLSLPTVDSLITLHEPKTGRLLSLMEGTYLTAIKTGAVGAVAAKHLARRGTMKAGIIGTGVQGEAQLWGLTEALEIEEAVVYGRDQKRRERFRERVERKLGIRIRTVDNSERVIRESDIVVTATTSATPVFDGRWLREGLHISGVGSFTPEAREIDGVSVERASGVFVDNMEAIGVGDLRMAIEEGRLSKESVVHLSEVILGRVQGRRTDQEITLFKSVGGAPYDVAVAQRAYTLARSKGIGVEIEF